VGNLAGIEWGDLELTQQLDAALAEAARRSGDWLVCRPGCCECCLGPFAITQLDAWRLCRGLAELTRTDPDRASRVRERARAFEAKISLDGADGDLCPALDPESRTCDLYSARPAICRSFGPPVRSEPEGLAVCELCFQGASKEQILFCAVESGTEGMEARLIEELHAATGKSGPTVVAACLAEAS